MDRVETVGHDINACVEAVTASPAACRRVLQTLTQLVRDGTIGTEPRWDSTLTAAQRLTHALQASAILRPGRR